MAGRSSRPVSVSPQPLIPGGAQGGGMAPGAPRLHQRSRGRLPAGSRPTRTDHPVTAKAAPLALLDIVAVSRFDDPQMPPQDPIGVPAGI